MFRLDNRVQHDAWGSVLALPGFLGSEGDGRPHSELWMGTHPLGPSRVRTPSGGSLGLRELVGPDGLPYLFKVLAADRPLSLQVHPDRAMAAAGYAAEEARGVPLDAWERTFKDPHHKPEMAVALTPFESLVGLRPTAELATILPAVGAPLTGRLAELLRADPGFAGIVRLLGVLLSDEHPIAAEEVGQVVRACADRVAQGDDPGRAYSTVVELARWHPRDPGVVASLLLNRISLQPGEAVFLAHGIIHAHLFGMCLELMADSDNVLRAGLTDKPVHREAVLACLRSGMSDTFSIEPKRLGASRLYVPPVEEFALGVTRRTDASAPPSPLPGTGPRIILALDGSVALHGAGTELGLRRGQSVFVPADEGDVGLTGTGAVAQAYAP